ncbi:ABC transporter ATP-binding protein [Actinomadura luteofluorescens]|uniref:ATP-binding cassette domain-containing protein n=1 Tax=Actinomadura luteofluorescens TaxID=46163 RepID=UPI0015C72C20|nr:ATP-binding cassette domain-containing protein [Actinomadura luteofluorescens]
MPARPHERTGPAAAGGPQRAGAPVTCQDVSVLFGDFRALDGVSGTFTPGKVHAIVGQNGAGKTTFARVLAGLVEPSGGTVQVGEHLLAGGNVAESRRQGVELVHQHFALPSDFTVAQALELFNDEHRPLGGFSRAGLHRRARTLLEDGGAAVAPDALIGRLPIETMQAVEIARALASAPRVLVLDEPTAVLPPPAMRGLFDRLRDLAVAGLCVIVVLHKLDEVFAVADTVTALRAGRLVLEPTPIGDLEPADVSRAIIGDASVKEVPAVAKPAPDAPVVLSTTRLTSRSGSHDAAATDVSLEVRAGEIVGIAGVEGNGQRSLVEALVGMAPLRGGTVSLAGSDISGASVRRRRDRGLRIIPFERNVEGVSLSSALWENHAAPRHAGDGLMLDPRALRERCREALDRWRVAYRTETQRAGDLSGGNVQKTVLAREITGDVRVLIAAHPTRGLDIAAAGDVRAALVDAAASGAAVLIVSADLEEMFEVCHRVLVMFAGRVVAEFDRPFDLDRVGGAMVRGEAA